MHHLSDNMKAFENIEKADVQWHEKNNHNSQAYIS